LLVISRGLCVSHRSPSQSTARESLGLVLWLHLDWTTPADTVYKEVLRQAKSLGISGLCEAPKPPSRYSDKSKAMGKSQSKLSQDQLVQLEKSTSFEKKELKQWYKGFVR
jgi:hypothetical protein